MRTRLQLLKHLIEQDLPRDELAIIRADFPAIARAADSEKGAEKITAITPKKEGGKKRIKNQR